MYFLVEIPKEFFTVQSMGTLATASAAVFIVCNGLQRAANFNPKWLALLVSLAVSLLGVYYTDGSSKEYFAGVINGFLIYSTVSGGTQILGTDRTPKASAAKPKRKFLTPWW